MKAPTPFNEEYRLAALHETGILDTPPEEAFDRITRLAASIFGVPIALVSLVDADRQWFKSRVGVEVSSTPRDQAFCAHAILGDDVLIVPDATSDPRFVDNPLVTGEAGIRFYAGAPLISTDGLRFGTLCVVDQVPRAALTAEQRGILVDLAAIVVDQLAVRRAHMAEAAHLRRKLESSELQARAATKAKRDFLAVVAHELRTPLNAVLGFSEVMRREMFGSLGNPRYLDYACNIHESGEHLRNLIDSVLDYSNAERGELRLSEEAVDVGEAIGHCARLISEQARRARVTVTTKAADALPELFADRDQTSQMLFNLVGNAVKFTPPGGAVTIEAATSADGGIVLRVSDDGAGIDADELHTALDVFSQLDSGLARRHEGLGLGLPLTKRLIELHGGSLELRSAGDRGTVAELHFPPYRAIRETRTPAGRRGRRA